MKERDIREHIYSDRGGAVLEDADIYVSLTCDGTSGDKTLEIEFARLLKYQFELFKKKQKSYGPHNVGAFQERGIFVRVWDKIQRLRNLVWDNKPNPLADENIEDTWVDIANYAMMAIICRRGQWPEYVDDFKKDKFYK